MSHNDLMMVLKIVLTTAAIIFAFREVMRTDNL